MKSMKSFIIKASIVAVSLASFGAHATSATSKYVKDVDLDFPGYAAVVHIKNTSANKNVEAINLQVQESNLDFLIHGSVECKAGISDNVGEIHFGGASAYFGSVIIANVNTINDTGSLHHGEIDVGYSDKDHPIAEYIEDTFSVPLSKLKNGHPLLRVDPLAELYKKLALHINNGGKAVDFYKQDHDIVLQRNISLVGICGKVYYMTPGYETKERTIQIKYEGDKDLYATTQVFLEVSPVKVKPAGNEQSQLNNILPFQLDKATFQPNMPNYVGKCIPDENPKIRMNFQMSGSKMGEIDIKIVGASNHGPQETYFVTTGMIKEAGSDYLDFEFPLKELLAKDQYSYMATPSNTTFNHHFYLKARYKDFTPGSTWSEYKNFDDTNFKHRCAPQVAVELGGNGGKLGYQEGNNPKPGLYVQPITPTPSPAKLGKKAPQKAKPLGVQAPKLAPKPLNVQVQTPKPSPKPLRLKSK